MNGSESFDLTGTGEARALACVRAGVCLWVSVLFVWRGILVGVESWCPFLFLSLGYISLCEGLFVSGFVSCALNDTIQKEVNLF